MQLMVVGVLHAVAAAAPATAVSPRAIEAGVDLRVELLSIIFRLAGHPEYNRARIASYAADIDKHFGPLRDHAVVRLARELRRRRGVSYDAPMSLAVHVTDAFALKERVPFDPHPPGLDQRWRLSEVREFLVQARAFVKEGKFREFVTAHQPLYTVAATRLTDMMARHAHLEWFEGFFGHRPSAEFRLSIGLANGGNCYGARIRLAEGEELHCILGAWASDADGLPTFRKGMVSTVVHEFCHSYANPLIDRHAAELESAARTLYARVASVMKRQAYGNWNTMMRESLVRACVVRYVKANDGDWAALKATTAQHRRGFTWVGQLATLLGEYERDRHAHPTLDTFMPRIVQFFDAYVGE